LFGKIKKEEDDDVNQKTSESINLSNILAKFLKLMNLLGIFFCFFGIIYSNYAISLLYGEK